VCNSCKIEVLALGSWIGIGVADLLTYHVENSSVLGTQKGVNASYHYQRSKTQSLLKLQAPGQVQKLDVKSAIEPGDFLEVRVDLEACTVTWAVNSEDVGTLKLRPLGASNCLPATLYFCACMSFGTKLRLCLW